MQLTPSVLLSAYAAGLFPMAEHRDDPQVFWVEPDLRGIFPLNAFHVPRRLKRRLCDPALSVRIDSDFGAVIDACASPAAGRDDTWINGTLRGVYTELHRLGHAHAIAVYERGQLIGGLYGVRLGAAFFGESMFSLGADGSKIALAHTAAHLNRLGFTLFDCQFWTDHLARFGCVEIPRDDYRDRLRAALRRALPWSTAVDPDAFHAFVQASTQTS